MTPALQAKSDHERTRAGWSTGKALVWPGRVLSTLVVVFLLFDGALKVLQLDVTTQATSALGYPVSVVFGLGVLTLMIAALFAYPRTAMLGAVLLTGLLGGAVATHVRVGSPAFSHTFFPVYVGVMAWLGLYLRDERLRALLPLSNPDTRRTP